MPPSTAGFESAVSGKSELILAVSSLSSGLSKPSSRGSDELGEERRRSVMRAWSFSAEMMPLLSSSSSASGRRSMLEVCSVLLTKSTSPWEPPRRRRVRDFEGEVTRTWGPERMGELPERGRGAISFFGKSNWMRVLGLEGVC